MRLLVLEDNARLAGVLAEHLKECGYLVDTAGLSRDFFEYRRRFDYDAYIVDINLPESDEHADGFKVIDAMRRESDSTPALVITARSSIDDRIFGLECGADDYLVKPFNVRELVARIRALARRAPEIAPRRVIVGRLALDHHSGDVTCDGERFELRPSERRLLARLMRRPGQLVTRDVIESLMPDQRFGRTENAVDQAVSRLRRALGRVPSGVELKTIRGMGYVLEERADVQ